MSKGTPTLYLYVGDIAHAPRHADVIVVDECLRPSAAEARAREIDALLAERAKALRGVELVTNDANLIDALPLAGLEPDGLVVVAVTEHAATAWTRAEADRFWRAYGRESSVTGELLKRLKLWT